MPCLDEGRGREGGETDISRYQSMPDDFDRSFMKPFLDIAPLAQLSEAEKAGAYKGHVDTIEKRGGRWGTPEEIAGIVGMLCSAGSGYCTGQGELDSSQDILQESTDVNSCVCKRRHDL